MNDALRVGDRWRPLVNPPHQHNYLPDITINPTCTEVGETTYSCECGDSYTEEIPALGHNYNDDYTIDQEPSCTVNGSRSRHCGRCSSTIDETPIDPLDHDFGEWYEVDSPDCINPGLKMHDCVRCLFSESESLDPLGHTWDTEFTIDREPTCTTDGSKSRHCIKCPSDDYAVIDDTVIPSLGHSWNNGVYTNPTYQNDGFTTYTCTRCGSTNVIINEGTRINASFQLTLDTSQIVNATTAADIAACSTTSAATTEITVGGVTFRKDQVTKVRFGEDFNLKSLHSFGRNFTNLVEIDRIPEGISGNSCLQYFLQGCEMFNQPITIPEGVTGKNCLYGFFYGCTSFNQPITIPRGVTGDWCLQSFLEECTSFNHPIIIPDGVTGNRCLYNFLQNCTSFNQPITIPEGVNGNQCLEGFLQGCTSFNSPITISEGVTGDRCLYNFLRGCNSFNQPITIPEGVSGNNCLWYFLSGCTSFNHSIIIPEGVSGNNCLTGFLNSCNNMVSPITVNDASGLVGNNITLSTSSNIAPMYTQGIPIIGSDADVFRAKFPNRSSSPYRNLK